MLDLLKDFVTTGITTVGVDLEEGLDIRDTGNDTSYSDKVTQGSAFDFTDGESVGCA